MRVRCTKAIPGFTVRKTYETKDIDTKGVIFNDTGHAVVAGPNMREFFEVMTAEEEKDRLFNIQQIGRGTRKVVQVEVKEYEGVAATGPLPHPSPHDGDYTVKELIDAGHLSPTARTISKGYDLADGPDSGATLVFVDIEDEPENPQTEAYRVAAQAGNTDAVIGMAAHNILNDCLTEADRVALLEEIARLSKSYLDKELGGLNTIAKVQKRLGPQYVTIKKLQWLLDNVPLTS